MLGAAIVIIYPGGSYHINYFHSVDLSGLKNPYGYGNSHTCLRSQKVKSV
jgi:hypothetical protein